jgi:hypothetical protein
MVLILTILMLLSALRLRQRAAMATASDAAGKGAVR